MSKTARELPKEIYNVQEAAEVLGVGANTVYNLSHTQGFPSFKLGKRILIPRKQLMEWVGKMTDGIPT